MSLTRDDKKALERYKEKLKRIAEFNHVNLNESDVEKRQRIAKAKKDYRYCVAYYFPHYATSECGDFQIEAANHILKNRSCISAEIWARGHAKSTHLDIMIPFWLWMNNEIDVMLLVGKNADDAKTLLSDLQAEFESNPQIIADFGEQKQMGSWEEGSFITKNEVAFFSLGRGQSPRGIRYRFKRPNIVVVDDIDDDEIADNQRRVKKVIKWLFGALYGAMDNKGARFIFANNLISNTGIIAHVIKKVESLKRKMKSARVNFVNALDKAGKPTWHQKYSKKHFEDTLEVMGDYAFQTEYQNNPQVEGKIFLDEQIQWAAMPKINSFECIVGHWDVAYSGTSTGDYNAVKIWALKGRKFYHLKAFVRQCKMSAAMRWMIEFQKQLPAGVKIHWRYESQFWNDALKMNWQEVQEETGKELLLIQCERPTKNKFDRIVSMQPHFQNARCFYNKKEQYNIDMQVGVNQLKAIEPGYNTHDDGPDADEGAITYLNRFIPSNNPLPLLGKRAKGADGW